MGRLRFATLGAVALTAAVVATPAFGEFSPRLVITAASPQLREGGGVKVQLALPQGNDPVATAAIYVPSGYRLTTTAPVGTKLGTVAATFFAEDAGSLALTTGTAEVASPAEVAEQIVQCTGSGTATHTAVWVLRLTIDGAPMTVPVVVDPVPPALASIASAQLVVCLAPPDVPAGTPGRAVRGARLSAAQFTLSPFANPSIRGEYRWRGVMTPYVPGQGRPNPAAAVEVQSLVDLPTQMTLKAKVRRSPKPGVVAISFTGLLIANREGFGDAAVSVLRGASPSRLQRIKTFRTDENGAFSGTVTAIQRKTASSLVLVATTTTEGEDLGAEACAATFVPPIVASPLPCIDATIGPVSVSSNVLKVSIPAVPKTKKKR